MRLLTIILLIAACLSIMGLYTLLSPPAQLPAAKSYGKAAIGGAFEAVDHTGSPITQEALKGNYSILYFGFTHCPDICPVGLLKIANALDAMGANAEKVTPYFVSVDPERDTPEVLARYVEHFHPRLVGITGSTKQIKQVTDAYKVYFRKVEEETALGYLVDHSGFMYFMSPEGEYLAHFKHSDSETELQAGMLRAMGETL